MCRLKKSCKAELIGTSLQGSEEDTEEQAKADIADTYMGLAEICM